MYSKSLHIFRRDLRAEDNNALNAALNNSEIVYPCFFIDPRQVTNNPYKNEQAISFMLQNLQELNTQLEGKLYFEYGKAEDCILNILKKERINAVFVNRDYTPFSRKRDNIIQRICEKFNVKFIQKDDSLLNPPERILKDNGAPYSIFTPFYKKAIKIKVPIVKNKILGNIKKLKDSSNLDKLETAINNNNNNNNNNN
ncbi:MAG: deoxyribodipyrimidine photo-lyase, partial [Nanobdellota archaeon]